MNSFEERMNKICNTEFTELRIKPLDEIHESGYRCFEITGYNRKTKEEMLITTVSDVIDFPCVKNPYPDIHDFNVFSMDWHPKNEYMRLFFINDRYRFKATWILSNFRFEVVDDE